jgi:hypothetical protein
MAVRFFILVLLASASHLQAQVSDSSAVNKKRLHGFIAASGVLYTASIIGLNQLWYSESEKEPFHFFNDNDQWKQVDKFGHFYSGFYLSYGYSKGLQWAGVTKAKSDLWGSLAGFMILVPIEIFDGFATDYGASAGDLLANGLGAGFYLGQSVLWDEIRLQPKFSFMRTEYPALRDDDVLGSSFITEMLKDYNGQTYWLSVNIDRFIRFPRWLNLVVGYGANGMVYAEDSQNEAAGYHAYRQYYLGIDFDLSHIKTRSKALNTALFFVNMIKLPAPAIRFSEKGTSFNAFQF